MKLAISQLSCLCIGIALPLFCGCDDAVDPADYGGSQPLATPVVSLQEAAFDQLSFAWTPVDGAVEYAYWLDDAQGNNIACGMTKTTEVVIDELEKSTPYQLTVRAYADVQSQQTTSEAGVLAVSTTFYPAVNAEGTYTPAILSFDWTATLVETRTTGDDHFGTFTLQAWYNHEDYDLVFEVNADGSINILNGEIDEESGWRKVMAGPSTGIKTNQYVRQGVLIDVTRCSFDREAHQLQIYSRSTKDASREGYDLFEWEEDE